MRFLTLWVMGCTLWVVLGLAHAQEQVPPDPFLNESVEMVAAPGFLAARLETTFFKPEGHGPFPIVVINHGKQAGNVYFQARYRPLHAVRYFMQRGYAVIVPMRTGFSRSGGSYVGGGCNVESNGHVQARDVKVVLDHVIRQPWADPQRILMLGQSHGGWTTLAFGTLAYPGVRGLVNFAGGLRQESCMGWEANLARAAAAYASQTRLPSVWFYGDNDSYFSPEVFRPMYDKYVAAGGQAQLVAFSRFGSDAHALFGSGAGRPIWEPVMTAFLQQLNLPHEVLAAFEKYGTPKTMVVPPPTNFAAVSDLSRLPHVRDSGRSAYASFLERPSPRAFAIAPSGAWGWANGGDDPLKRALDHCNRRGAGACRLYAIDEDVVWATGD
ncbi:MAG: hypothetical protein RLZZ153_1668 [Pseudomonadota bacterium]